MVHIDGQLVRRTPIDGLEQLVTVGGDGNVVLCEPGRREAVLLTECARNGLGKSKEINNIFLNVAKLILTKVGQFSFDAILIRFC